MKRIFIIVFIFISVVLYIKGCIHLISDDIDEIFSGLIQHAIFELYYF